MQKDALQGAFSSTPPPPLPARLFRVPPSLPFLHGVHPWLSNEKLQCEYTAMNKKLHEQLYILSASNQLNQLKLDNSAMGANNISWSVSSLV